MSRFETCALRAISSVPASSKVRSEKTSRAALTIRETLSMFVELGPDTIFCLILHPLCRNQIKHPNRLRLGFSVSSGERILILSLRPILAKPQQQVEQKSRLLFQI